MIPTYITYNLLYIVSKGQHGGWEGMGGSGRMGESGRRGGSGRMG